MKRQWHRPTRDELLQLLGLAPGAISQSAAAPNRSTWQEGAELGICGKAHKGAARHLAKPSGFATGYVTVARSV